mmetsp:Transcript_17330/g.31819  ORF Transcript_17330/g.31819 Transcript_17330/m.31819 type:complete len:286 (+) Transcript_17330:42-899(+)
MRLSLLAVTLACGVDSFAPLRGVRVSKVNAPDQEIDLGTSLADSGKCTLLVLGTYAADFNAIEYGQRLKHYLPELKARGVENFKIVLNAEPEACTSLATMLELPQEVELLSDPTGAAGRAFGVERGFRPDDDTLSPFLKLFAMLLGFGAPWTLPYVITGYLGNPWGSSGWIETSLAAGQRQGRWPDNALDLGSDGGVEANKFSELPLVGGWGRRPLELATLRLQNMISISIKEWGSLAPDTSKHPAVLTQLGGCVVVDGSGTVKYEWRDPGICAVSSFDDIVASL